MDTASVSVIVIRPYGVKFRELHGESLKFAKRLQVEHMKCCMNMGGWRGGGGGNSAQRIRFK